MAQYKVPQDVEADDKLIGPFSFRQFVYLLVAAGLVALCIPLFNIFPLLIILPAPFILFLLALSLPLKKDQPMETYLSAVISFRRFCCSIVISVSPKVCFAVRDYIRRHRQKTTFFVLSFIEILRIVSFSPFTVLNLPVFLGFFLIFTKN